jgi:hypothetical protein
MQAIEQSRLLNNLRRDLRSNYKMDESLSVLNISGEELKITDTHTNITKIIYPRTMLRTARPKKSLIIKQEGYTLEIPRSALKSNLIGIDTPIKYVDEIGNYAELLNNKWVNKVMNRADIFIITPSRYYVIYNNEEQPNITLIIFILLISLIAGIILLLNLNHSIPIVV